MFRKQNSAAISHPSLLTACQMALAVTSGLSRTCAISGLVTHYIRVGATGTNKQYGQNAGSEYVLKTFQNFCRFNILR
jgi:hypothetical protein